MKNRISIVKKLRYIRAAQHIKILFNHLPTITIAKLFIRLKSIIYPGLIGAISIDLTDRCNKKCSYCYHANVKINQSVDPSLENIGEILRQAKNSGASQVILLGGEPMIRTDIFDVVKKASSEGLLVELCTNGIQINKNSLYKLEESGLDIIVYAVELSDDVAVQSMMKLIRLTSNSRLRIKINGLVDVGDSIKKQFYNSRKLLRSGAHNLNMMGIVDNKFPVLPLSEQYKGIAKIPSKKEKYLRWYKIHKKFKGDKNICEALAGNTLHINTDGDVLFCHAVPLNFGNVHNEEFGKIIRRKSLHPIFRIIRKNCLFTNDNAYPWLERIKKQGDTVELFNMGEEEPISGLVENPLSNNFYILKDPLEKPGRETISMSGLPVRIIAATPPSELICLKSLEKCIFRVRAGFNPRGRGTEISSVKFSIYQFAFGTSVSNIREFFKNIHLGEKSGINSSGLIKVDSYSMLSDVSRTEWSTLSAEIDKKCYIVLHTEAEKTADFSWAVWGEPEFESRQK